MQDTSLAIKRLDEIQIARLCGIEIGSHINGIPLAMGGCTTSMPPPNGPG